MKNLEDFSKRELNSGAPLEASKLELEGQKAISSGFFDMSAGSTAEVALNKFFPTVVMASSVGATLLDLKKLTNDQNLQERNEDATKLKDDALATGGSIIGTAISARFGFPKFLGVSLGYEVGKNARETYDWLTAHKK